MKQTWYTFLAKQFRKPTGLLGYLVANMMQKRNTVTYEWMSSQINFEQTKNILEIGYGTGKLLNLIAMQHSDVRLYGIDFSKIMYQKAKKLNQTFIESNRMTLEYGDVINYASTITFDVIYFTNVIYFWNDLTIYFDKLQSLLNPNGRLYIYMADADYLNAMPMTNTSVFNRYSLDFVKETLKKHQFSHIHHQTKEISNKKTYCISAIKAV